MKVILRGHVVVPVEDLEAVRAELDEHIRLTRLEEGCLSFEVTPNETDPTRFEVHEEFVDRTAFERHQERVRTSAWGRATGNVARHYRVTEV